MTTEFTLHVKRDGAYDEEGFSRSPIRWTRRPRSRLRAKWLDTMQIRG